MAKGKKNKKPFKPVKVSVRHLEREWRHILRAVRWAAQDMGETAEKLGKHMESWDEDHKQGDAWFEKDAREARELLHRFISILEEATRRREIVRGQRARPVATVLPCIRRSEKEWLVQIAGAPTL